MDQERLNSMILANAHTEQSYSINLVNFAQEFASSNDTRIESRVVSQNSKSCVKHALYETTDVCLRPLLRIDTIMYVTCTKRDWIWVCNFATFKSLTKLSASACTVIAHTL